LAAACLFSFFATAQPDIEAVQLLTHQEGLSDRAVRDITQDSRGFLWVATDNGLNRYDGYRFRVFDSNTGQHFKLKESRLVKVREIKNGKLALLNTRDRSSVELLDIHSFENQFIEINEKTGVKGEVKAVFLEEKGDVFVVAAYNGAFHFYKMDEPGVFKKTGVVTWPGLRFPDRMGLIRGRSGNFWLMDTLNGLAEVSVDGKLLRRLDMEIINATVVPAELPYFTSVLHEDISGRLWVAFPFRQGVFNVEPGSLKLERPSGLPPGEVYTGAWEDSKGQLLLGTYLNFGRLHHLFLIEKNREVFEYPSILDVDEKINVIHGQDFKQQIFAGTFVGINNINLAQRPFRWVLADRQLDDSNWDDGISIRGVTGDGRGNIFIARELKAWYHLKLPSFEVDTILPRDDEGTGLPLRLWCCSNLVYDEAGFLWGGSCTADLSGRLYRYELSTGKTRIYEMAHKAIRHIVRSQAGGLWLLCGAEGDNGKLVYFDPRSESFNTYLDEGGANPLDGLFPAFLLESKTGKIWIGTDEGLVGIDPVKKQSHIVKRGNNSLTNDNILVIHEAGDGRLWLGTYGGLAIFNPATGDVEGYSLADGLCNNIVCGILPDGEGHYWLSTYSGISFFDPQTRLFSNFLKDKGLTFNEFNRLANYRDEKGNFYFGTLNGLNVFRNGDFQRSLPKYFPVQLTSIEKISASGAVKAQEAGLSGLGQVEFSHGDVQVRLEFTLPDFAYPHRNRYAVWLEGVDEKWRFLGGQNFIEITGLPAGRYVLRIKAAAANGFWNEDELRLMLVVKQAFYQTTWFQVSLPLGILGLSYFFSRLIIGRVRLRERERTAINKKFAELELQALQSQMNPHFVFNSLGAIQYFIQNNKAKAADEYLTKFAKLMRLFLESSKNKYITLEEEIKLLSLYIELEQMRFENKFHAEIQVDENVDVHTCEIPSVLIQPFVENAINHGFFHKKDKGHLFVRFLNEEDGVLTCIIEDDGIGRRRAQELKEKSPRQHTSIGMQLVKERLEVLKQMDALNIHFEIEDIESQTPGKTGTRVVLKVPLSD